MRQEIMEIVSSYLKKNPTMLDEEKKLVIDLIELVNRNSKSHP